MTSVASALRRAVVRLDDLLLAARDRLTPGQRWTATILGLVAVAVLLAGSPTRTLVLPGDRAAGAGQAAPSVVAEADRPAFDVSVGEPSGTTPAAIEGPSSPDEGSSGTRPAGPDRRAEPRPAARITVLLPPASGGLPGRTEADAAQLFVQGADFEVAATAGTDDADACGVAGGSGVVVLGPEAVPPELVACLTASGATLLAFDAGGSRDGVVSTRRSHVDALVALASWAAATDRTLTQAVGIVGGTEDETWVDAAVPAMAEAGLDVVASAFVGEPTSVSSEVRAFVAEGVETVVLAAPVEVRRQWAAQHALLDPSVRFVVADAHDGVGQEGYAPTFDGALAHTTLRVPWHAREHGESPEQSLCRERWEESAVPPMPMSADETRWVFAWCQHVALVGAAGQAADASGEPLADAIRSLTMPSPLTSDLGPTGDGGWGPTAHAVLVWRSSCGCWQEQTPFRDDVGAGAAARTVQADRRSVRPSR